jgi:hypothetical protein
MKKDAKTGISLLYSKKLERLNQSNSIFGAARHR